LEVKEKTKQKELKRIAKDTEKNEKSTRKKQKEDQKIGHAHFSEFIKAKAVSG
jgi:hypothetical protein